MTTIEIKKRITGEILWTGEAETVREALVKAVSADANLARANLARAYLARANLARAYLARAYLARAKGIDLGAHVEPPTPYVRRAPEPRPDRPVLTPKERKTRRLEARAEHAKRYRERHPDVPVVEHLDSKILQAIESTPGAALEMGAWHTCGTTHCRGGWAVHLAGDALEQKLGDPALAARAIYVASTGRAPHFYATNERALEDLRRCAAEDAAAQ